VNDSNAREEVAKLRTELQSAEEREAAVRDVIQTIARSTFDLEVVLQTVETRWWRQQVEDSAHTGEPAAIDLNQITKAEPPYNDIARFLNIPDNVIEQYGIYGPQGQERFVVEVIQPILEVALPLAFKLIGTQIKLTVEIISVQFKVLETVVTFVVTNVLKIVDKFLGGIQAIAEAASPKIRSLADLGGASLVSAAAMITFESDSALTESSAARVAVVADLKEVV